MAQNTQIQIELPADVAELLARYQQITGTSPEQYVNELVVKTTPTIKAIVEAMEEAAQSDDPEKVMQLFGEKMAKEMVARRNQVASEQGDGAAH